MARKEITVRSRVKFSDTGEIFTMEEVDANPELRKRFDERLKAVLEEGIPRIPGIMKALIEDTAPRTVAR